MSLETLVIGRICAIYVGCQVVKDDWAKWPGMSFRSVNDQLWSEAKDLCELWQNQFREVDGN